MSSVGILLKKSEEQYPAVIESPLISVVIPVFNEQANIPICHQRVCSVLDSLGHGCEIVYVDDGSNDASWMLLQEQQSLRHHVVRLRLSRNFGKEAALSAGLNASRGKGVVPLDADLQDPPELIPAMIEAWQGGVELVQMQRCKRQGESWLKRYTAALFYKTMRRLSEVPFTENVGDFCLLDRRVVEQINQLPERSRYMKGLFAWPGFRRTTLVYNRDPRLAGRTKWSYAKLTDLAMEGITSSSIRPLRLATFAGLFCTLASVLATAVLAYLGSTQELTNLYGMVSLTVALLLGGIQLLAIGLLGEYLGRLYMEAKQRPLYVLMEESMTPAMPAQQEVH